MNYYMNVHDDDDAASMVRDFSRSCSNEFDVSKRLLDAITSLRTCLYVLLREQFVSNIGSKVPLSLDMGNKTTFCFVQVWRGCRKVNVPVIDTRAYPSETIETLSHKAQKC